MDQFDIRTVRVSGDVKPKVSGAGKDQFGPRTLLRQDVHGCQQRIDSFVGGNPSDEQEIAVMGLRITRNNQQAVIRSQCCIVDLCGGNAVRLPEDTGQSVIVTKKYEPAHGRSAHLSQESIPAGELARMIDRIMNGNEQAATESQVIIQRMGREEMRQLDDIGTDFPQFAMQFSPQSENLSLLVATEIDKAD